MLPYLSARGLRLEKRDITDDGEWYDAYWSRIPVVMMDGRVILEGKPGEGEVRGVMERI